MRCEIGMVPERIGELVQVHFFEPDPVHPQNEVLRSGVHESTVVRFLRFSLDPEIDAGLAVDPMAFVQSVNGREPGFRNVAPHHVTPPRKCRTGPVAAEGLGAVGIQENHTEIRTVSPFTEDEHPIAADAMPAVTPTCHGFRIRTKITPDGAPIESDEIVAGCIKLDESHVRKYAFGFVDEVAPSGHSAILN